MSTEVLLNVLKYIGILLSAVFGMLSLRTEYKDKDGKPTMWGRIALVGVLASAAITAGIQTFEIAQANRERLASEKRSLALQEQNSELLRDINRSLNPLRNVSASFWLPVSLGTLDLESFKVRFMRDAQPVIATLEKHSTPDRSMMNTYASATDASGKVLSLFVRQDSPLFPRRIDERFAWTVFGTSSISMYFYRTPIRIEEFPYFGSHVIGTTKEPDLTMLFGDPEGNGYARSLEYNPTDQSFSVRASSFITDSKYWKSTGRIVSVLDLAGSQVFIVAGHLLVSFQEREKRIYPHIQSVFLQIDDRQDLLFRGDKLLMHKRSDGQITYEYRFPKTMDEVYADLRR